jgi:hypothetical protein
VQRRALGKISEQLDLAELGEDLYLEAVVRGDSRARIDGPSEGLA